MTHLDRKTNSERPRARGARLVIAVLLCVSSLAPFLSNARPLTLVMDGARTWPLFAALTTLDILWVTALLASIPIASWCRRRGRMTGWVALLTLAIGMTLAAVHDTKLDARRYLQESALREELAELDARILDSDESVLGELRSFALTAGAVRAVSIDVEDRLIALEDSAPMPSVRTLIQDNESTLQDLLGASFVLNPHSPKHSNSHTRNQRGSLSGAHWLGTDPRGRDLLAILIHGTRTAFTIAVPIVVITMLIGLLVGGMAGLYGGFVDSALSRLIELVMCLPVLVLLVLFASWLPQGPSAMIVILSCVFWTHPARLVRAEARRVAQEDFVAAARILGASNWHILRTHIIPHSIPPLIVSASFTLGWAIMVESSLSFLGLGVAGTASWGELLMLARADLGEAAHTAVWAGTALFAVVCSANIIGDRAGRSVS